LVGFVSQDTPKRNRALRAPPFFIGLTCTKRLAELEAMCRTCESIRNGVGTILRGNGVLVRL
jgi:hypothetical protein